MHIIIICIYKIPHGQLITITTIISFLIFIITYIKCKIILFIMIIKSQYTDSIEYSS